MSQCVIYDVASSAIGRHCEGADKSVSVFNVKFLTGLKVAKLAVEMDLIQKMLFT